MKSMRFFIFIDHVFISSFSFLSSIVASFLPIVKSRMEILNFIFNSLINLTNFGLCWKRYWLQNFRLHRRCLLCVQVYCRTSKFQIYPDRKWLSFFRPMAVFPSSRQVFSKYLWNSSKLSGHSSFNSLNITLTPFSTRKFFLQNIP